MEVRVSYLILDRETGYPYGVMAQHADATTCELHGPFANADEAQQHGNNLLAEYEDYEGFTVVKIETPQVGTRPA